MSSIPVGEALDAFDAAIDGLAGLDWDTLSVRELLTGIERLESARRRATAIAGDAARAVTRRDGRELGGLADKVVADVVRITLAEARRRIRDATALAPRTTLTGDTLAPDLPATAQAWHAGTLDPEHLRAIQRFHRDLPADIHPDRAAKAEAFLAEQAALLRPDQLGTLAQVLATRLNPDGRFTDDDRARQRGFTWCGPQRPDGMSVGRLVATPALRAELDAWLAKFAAPGMGNPADPTPTVEGEPTPEAADRDNRSYAQRQHDAVALLVRSQLGNPALGQHRGLPVTVIATATIEQLEKAAGWASTGGGTRLPMTDLIRMASHAYHYLCVYREHDRRPLYLGRTKRIASADQRLVLHALHRGCTAPGCTAPGYHSEVHHIDDWATGGNTNVDTLTLACGPDHARIGPDGWTTRVLSDGRTQWIPPPQLPLKPGTNTYHHPERILEQFERFGDLDETA